MHNNNYNFRLHSLFILLNTHNTLQNTPSLLSSYQLGGLTRGLVEGTEILQCVLAILAAANLLIYLTPTLRAYVFSRFTLRSSAEISDGNGKSDEPSSVNKDLVVHGAYFDDRPRGGHTNTTVILLTIKRTIIMSNQVTGCGVDTARADEYLVKPTYQQARRFRVYTHEQYVLNCYDMPVANGSKVFVTYKTTNSTTELVVESEVLIPPPRVQPTGKYNFTVATCTKAFDKNVKYLPEFVRYQKTIGVDHVHLSVLDQFVRDGGLQDIVMQDSFLSEAVQSGYLSISVLKVWYTKKETFLNSSVYQRLGCFYRLRGTYDYISIADTDDFFTPRIPGETNIKYYVQNYCIEKATNVGSCRFQWRWLFPDVCGSLGQVGPDGNVTKTVNVPKLEVFYKNTKSMHSSKGVIDFSFHEAKGNQCILPGYEVVEMPTSYVYFAHNRPEAKRKLIKVC